MLYSEFIKGTGCKDTPNNYKVYADLDILYMHSDLSKEDIYAYGKKLVDNSLTESEQRLNEGLQADIEKLQNDLKAYKDWIAYHETNYQLWKDSDKDYAKSQRDSVRYYEHLAKETRFAIRQLKSLIVK